MVYMLAVYSEHETTVGAQRRYSVNDAYFSAITHDAYVVVHDLTAAAKKSASCMPRAAVRC